MNRVTALAMLLVATLALFVHNASASHGTRVDGRSLFATRAETFGLPFEGLAVSHIGGNVKVTRDAGDNREVFAVTQQVNDSGVISFEAFAPSADGAVEKITGTLSLLPNGSPRIEYAAQLSAGGYESGAMTALVPPGGLPPIILMQQCDCTDGVDMNCTPGMCNAGDNCSPTNTKKCKWKTGGPATMTPLGPVWQPVTIEYNIPYYMCGVE